MSQPVQQPPPQQRPPGNRIAGLPMWGWVAVAAAGGIVLILWLRSRKTTAATTPTTTDTSGSGNDIASELSVLQTEIQNLQGAPSQPLTPGSRQSYFFKLTNDANPGAIYVGIPGSGYFWIPNPALFQAYLSARPRTVDLGTIGQSDAQSRFGQQKPWSAIGQASGSTPVPATAVGV